MKSLFLLPIAGLATAPFLVQQSTPLDAAALKKMISGLGFVTKELSAEVGKEKYEFSIARPDFNVPIGAEISPSKNYIWFTVRLGDIPTDVTKHAELLKENAKVQPNFFYVTSKGWLMLAVAMDNREVSPAVIKRVTEKLAEDVSKTSAIWAKPAN